MLKIYLKKKNENKDYQDYKKKIIMITKSQ